LRKNLISIIVQRLVILLLMLNLGAFAKAQVQLAPTSDTLCPGESLTFSATSSCLGNVIYSFWVNGDSILSNASGNFVFLPTQNSHQIQVVCACDVNGTVTLDTASTLVTLLSANLSAGPDQTVDSGTVVTLQASGNFDSLVWSPSYLINYPTLPSVQTTPFQTTTYMLTAYYSGCTFFDYVTVFLSNVLNVPNTFSPNNDGSNDVWIIPGIENYPDNRMVIMNRFGDLLYESASYGTVNAWAGTRNGKVLPDGVYYYLLELGNGVVKKGTISIVR
jgi:gliding motility-associated-like protein